MKGADPELFVADQQGEIVPVVGLLGGTKDNPLAVVGGAVQEDNVLAEFNIAAARDETEWVHNLTTVMAEVDRRLAAHGCHAVILPAYDFDMGVLVEAGEQALVAGCEPDYNAWEQASNPRPELGTLRTAAGHIHFDVPAARRTMGTIGIYARAHDLYLGVPSVLMDKDTMRRKLYGRAGCFRLKHEYGGEYRTLSNFWLATTDLMRWAYRNSERAVAGVGAAATRDPRIQECIDTYNTDLARQLVDEYKLEVA